MKNLSRAIKNNNLISKLKKKKEFLTSVVTDVKLAVYFPETASLIKRSTIISTTASAFKYGLPYIGYKSGDPTIFFSTLATSWSIQQFYPTYIQKYTSPIGPAAAKKLGDQAMQVFYTLPSEEVVSDPLGKINQYFAKINGSFNRLPNMLFGSLVPASINFGFSCIALATVNPELAAGFAFATMSHAYLTYQGEKVKVEEQKELMQVVYKTFGSTLKRLELYELANIFCQTKKEKEKYSQATTELKDAMIKNLQATHSLTLKQSMVTTLSMISLISYAMYQLRSGGLNSYELGMIIFYINMAIQPLNEVTRAYAEFTDAHADYLEVKDFLKRRTLLNPKLPDQPTIISETPEIRFSQVKFSYDQNNLIFNNASFEIPAGKTTLIVGLSGGGKSTIINLLLRFYEMEGDITIDGVSIRDMNIENLRKAFGIVPQNALLFDGTLKENLTYGTESSDTEKLNKIIQLTELSGIIEKLPEGLETMIGKQGAKLSGGIKQRITIARALMTNPRIFVFDEATSSLDIETEMKLLESIAKVTKGKTTIIITHKLNTIPFINPDQILVVKDGLITERGTYNYLMHQKHTFFKLMKKHQDAVTEKQQLNESEKNQQVFKT